MSAIGGIIAKNGLAPSIQAVTALAEAMTSRGADGCQYVIRENAAVIHRNFRTAAQLRVSIQPLVDSGGVIVAWDGRLDNREEVLAAIGEGAATSADVEVLAAAYRRWGNECVPHLTGDFAFSIWDNRRRSLLLGRDAIGTRPLYYAVTPESVIWASEICALLNCPEVDADIDNEYVAGYIVAEPDPSHSPFKSIKPVPPGSVVMIAAENITVRRHWLADAGRELRYATDGEYEAHFRELFFQSVRRRLRSDRPVCAELSGGLDSSSIVCVADRIISCGESEAPSLKTLSYVFDGSPTSDEREYIAAVEDQRGERGFHLAEESCPILSEFPYEGFIDFPTPLSCFGGRCDQVAATMREAGARVLLRGEGGDQVLWGEVDVPFELADLTRDMNASALSRQLIKWSTHQRKSLLHLLWRGAVWPCLPRAVRCLVGAPVHASLSKCLDPEFAARFDLKGRLLGYPEADEARFRYPSTREQYRILLWVISLVSGGYAGYYSKLGTVEISYPFLDKTLIEFLLAIPIEQKLRPGETRSLLRRALRDIVPRSVMARTDKKGPDEAIHRAMFREWPTILQLIDNSEICARGYVSSTGLRRALEAARHGLPQDSQILLRFLSLEIWLRSVAGWRRQRPRSLNNREEVFQLAKAVVAGSSTAMDLPRSSSELPTK